MDYYRRPTDERHQYQRVLAEIFQSHYQQTQKQLATITAACHNHDSDVFSSTIHTLSLALRWVCN